MDHFNRLSPNMQDIIVHSIKVAVDIFNDNNDEQYLDTLNALQYRESLFHTVIDIISMELDPDSGVEPVSEFIKKSVKEKLGKLRLEVVIG